MKPTRRPPPIPPNYVSLRQLKELRLEEKRLREEEVAAAAAAVAKREAARKVEMDAAAAAAVKRDAARNPETKVSASVSVAPVRAKERRDGVLGSQWVAVAHRPAVPQPARREALPEAVPIGESRDNKWPADAVRGGGKPEWKSKGEGKEKVLAAGTRAQMCTADHQGKPAKISSDGSKLGNTGDWKGKAKASGDESAEPGSIGGSGESVAASSRHRKNPKGKKGAGRRSAEPSADCAFAKAAGASPQQGVSEKAGKPKSPGPILCDASPTCDSSHGKKADATPAAAGRDGELRITAGTNPEGPVEGHRRSPVLGIKGAVEEKPRILCGRRWSRPPGDRYNGAGEQQRGRVWVPKAAAAPGSAEI